KKGKKPSGEQQKPSGEQHIGDTVMCPSVLQEEALCPSSSPTRSLFYRAPFSPRSSTARTSSFKMSPSNPKTIFPDQIGPPQQDSPLKSPRRLSFSGIFRSTPRHLNQQPLSSPVSMKLFTRNKRVKVRGTESYSLSSPPPHYLPRQEDVNAFRLETYQTEPKRLETRRLRSFSSPPDTGQRSPTPSCFQLLALAPPIPVGRLVSTPSADPPCMLAACCRCCVS
uniref:Uncharacterized protein n=1 Tax=Cyclopterus lumpus TaxID=8103 RepID=A0A8C2WVY8_CYCLU